jgi:hypothetical protein
MGTDRETDERKNRDRQGEMAKVTVAFHVLPKAFFV